MPQLFEVGVRLGMLGFAIPAPVHLTVGFAFALELSGRTLGFIRSHEVLPHFRGDTNLLGELRIVGDTFHQAVLSG